MVTVGIDIGSVTVKAAVIDDRDELISWELNETGPRPRNTLQETLDAVFKKAGFSAEASFNMVATGYGRNLCGNAFRKITEISCLARGVNMLYPDCRTIIDIGGQDTKVIHVNENGGVRHFDMNDKCAAGTGRFLEVMARALQMSLEDMGSTSLKFKKDLKISSLCTVFAESEVVSLIAEDNRVEDILHGIHDAIAARVVTLVERLGLKEKVALTGGVAFNEGVVHCLKDRLGVPLYIHDKPQIIGAMGAAALARERS